MYIEFVSEIKEGRQDGAIHNGFLFSFNSRGECNVYELSELENEKTACGEAFAEFVLDKNEQIVPHSNSVTFGSEYYEENDEFPLLYSNIYNNYGNELKGVCLVYRLQREGKTFTSSLVQMIEIGFTEDENYWKSSKEKDDVRPYGNFVVDKETNMLYAFTMRDNTHTTRYFAFELPKVYEGAKDEKYGVKKVVLNTCDIIDYFDCDYHHYVQGACINQGKIYSLEGFRNSEENPPVLRIIDVKEKKEILFFEFKKLDINVEPEMIDFYKGVCYYGDHNGNFYKLNF